MSITSELWWEGSLGNTPSGISSSTDRGKSIEGNVDEYLLTKTKQKQQNKTISGMKAHGVKDLRKTGKVPLLPNNLAVKILYEFESDH